MLVLSRKVNEKIMIDFNGVIAEVCVVELRGDKVRLGFVAPLDVQIHREEVYKSIHQPKGEQK